MEKAVFALVIILVVFSIWAYGSYRNEVLYSQQLTFDLLAANKLLRELKAMLALKKEGITGTQTISIPVVNVPKLQSRIKYLERELDKKTASIVDLSQKIAIANKEVKSIKKAFDVANSHLNDVTDYYLTKNGVPDAHMYKLSSIKSDILKLLSSFISINCSSNRSAKTGIKYYFDLARKEYANGANICDTKDKRANSLIENTIAARTKSSLNNIELGTQLSAIASSIHYVFLDVMRRDYCTNGIPEFDKLEELCYAFIDDICENNNKHIGLGHFIDDTLGRAVGFFSTKK